MNEIKLNAVVEGQTALPPETMSTRPVAEGAPFQQEAKPSLPADNTAKVIAARVKAAEQDFLRQTVELIETEGRGLFLRLSITLAYIWLKIGNEAEYVDDLLEKLQRDHKDELVPSKKTFQHYEGPMLRWFAELARRKNPKDPNLREKFSPTFLRSHPQYILGVGEPELKVLQSECRTLLGLDEKFGNGRLKPEKIQPAIALNRPKPSAGVSTAGSASNGEEKRPKTPVAKSSKKYPAKPKIQSSLVPHSSNGEGAPSNDELLVKIDGVYTTLLAMQEAGIQVDLDVTRALMKCCVTAKKIQDVFRRHDMAA